MSASCSRTTSNEASVRPNWRRVAACAEAASSATCAAPTQPAAIAVRPQASTCARCSIPRPGSPMMRVRGISTPSRCKLVVDEPRSPSLRSSPRAATPVSPRSSKSRLCPRRAPPMPGVAATMVNTCARPPLVT